MKAEHSDLVEKKNALKSALCAARGTETKFDQIASFWEEFVLEPEERERMEQRRNRLSNKKYNKKGGSYCWKNSISVTKAKSVGEQAEVGFDIMEKQSDRCLQSSSKDDSNLLSCLLQTSVLCKTTSGSTATTDQQRSDHRRCDSVEDRGTSRWSGKMEDMMPKPKPDPIFIKVDFSRVQPPVAYHGDAAAAAKPSVALGDAV